MGGETPVLVAGETVLPVKYEEAVEGASGTLVAVDALLDDPNNDEEEAAVVLEVAFALEYGVGPYREVNFGLGAVGGFSVGK